MTLRADILEVVRELVQEQQDASFTAPDVVRVLRQRGTPYKELSIRSHVSYAMCAITPDPHGRRSQDFERLSRGRYRLR
ncbi:hypothetical protein [Deinococcus yunweiensis]|uniref:DUF7669 domain-containing protein n=1 Tax=Deinococcus yunweiensis TaxID=367282 RepID=UPI00398E5863